MNKMVYEEDEMDRRKILENIRERYEIIKKKNIDPKLRGMLIWTFQIAVVLVFAAVVAIFFFQSVTMQESSMEPTYTVGQKFFVNKVAYKVGSPKRGDIIVFRTNASDDAALHIRRVIGLPGETIRIKDGQIYIDGELYREGRGLEEIENEGLAKDGVTLQSGEYFVLGDNRNNSEDSRYADIGNVNKKYIEGKLWFVNFPWKQIGFVKE